MCSHLKVNIVDTDSNLGPLLYHFADSDNELSVELTHEEILHISQKLGFKIEVHKGVTLLHFSLLFMLTIYLFIFRERKFSSARIPPMKRP